MKSLLIALTLTVAASVAQAGALDAFNPEPVNRAAIEHTASKSGNGAADIIDLSRNLGDGSPVYTFSVSSAAGSIGLDTGKFIDLTNRLGDGSPR